MILTIVDVAKGSTGIYLSELLLVIKRFLPEPKNFRADGILIIINSYPLYLIAEKNKVPR